MDTSLIIERLIKDFQYSPRGAQVAAEKLVLAPPKIKDAFDNFLSTGDLPDWDTEGYTVQRLMEEHGMKPLAAMLTMDWLKRNPEDAKKSLAKGHDWVKKK